MLNTSFSFKTAVRRLLLATAMVSTVGGLAPVTVFAEAGPAEGGHAESPQGLSQALGGDTNTTYDEKTNDKLVTLKEDIKDISSPLIIASPKGQTNADIILDLDGHTLDLGDKALTVMNGAVLTIKDSSTGHAGKITSSGEVVISVGKNANTPDNEQENRANAKLDIQGGNIVNTIAADPGEDKEVTVIKAVNTSTITVANATVTANTESADDAIDLSDGSNLTVNNSKIDGNVLGIDAADGCAVTIEGDETTVNGKGAVEIGDSTGKVPNSSTFTMKGGLLASDASQEEHAITANLLDLPPINEKAGSQIQGGTIESNYGTAVQVGTDESFAGLSISGVTIQQGSAEDAHMVSGITVKNKDSVVDINGGPSKGVSITNANTTENGGYAIQNGSKEDVGGTVNIERATVDASGVLPTIVVAHGGHLNVGPLAKITSTSPQFSTVYVGLSGAQDEENPTTFNMTDGEIVNNASENGYGVSGWGYSELEISGGNISAPNGVGMISNGSAQNTKMTVKGGKVSGQYGIYAPSPFGQVEVSGGQVVGSVTGAEIRGGSLNLTNGTIETTAKGAPSFTPNNSGTTVSNAAIALSTHVTQNGISFTGSGGKVVTPNEAKSAAIYTTSSQVEEAQNPITLKISGGDYKGVVDTAGKSGYITSGTFVGAGDTFWTDGSTYAGPGVLVLRVIPASNPTTFYVGNAAKENIASIPAGDEIDFLQLDDQREFTANTRTTIKNLTSEEIKINGKSLSAGSTWVVNEDVSSQTAELQKYIDQAKALVPEKYTPASYKAVTDAVEEAEALLALEAPSSNEIIDMTKKLKDVLDALEVDSSYEAPGNKDDLAIIINSAHQRKEADYIPGAWQRFQTALQAAEEVYNSENPTEAQVQEAYDNLQKALRDLDDNLVNSPKATLDELNALIQELEAYDSSKYTEESFAKFQEAIEAAKQVANDPSATKAALSAQISALREARASLDELTTPVKPSKDGLNALITQAKGMENQNYPENLWSNFQSALTAAIQVAENENATQTEIGQATNALRIAIQDLLDLSLEGTPNGTVDPSAVNFTGLNNLITQAEALTQSNFTPESWDELQTALTAAKEVANNKAATQEEIDAAATTLSDALAGLINPNAQQQTPNATDGNTPSGTQTANGSSTATSGSGVTSKISSKLPDTGFAAFGSVLTSLSALGAGIFTKRRIH